MLLDKAARRKVDIRPDYCALPVSTCLPKLDAGPCLQFQLLAGIVCTTRLHAVEGVVHMVSCPQVVTTVYHRLSAVSGRVRSGLWPGL